MAKSKGKSETEYLRGELRKSKSIIKHLKKEVGRQNKRNNRVDDLEEQLAEQYLKEETLEKKLVKEEQCPDCGRSLEKISIGPRDLVICNECKYRRVIKK